MKTFEERYTAWIDDKLEGPALTSFELELSRRASAGEARADKQDAVRLHQLLTTHLKAPAMTNADFFSHQLRERIEGERATGRRREEARQARGSIFTWPFARLVGLGAATLFVATALYYGMMPPHSMDTAPVVATNTTLARPGVPAVAPVPQAEAVAQRASTAPAPGTEQLAMGAPTPPPVDLNANIQVFNGPAATTGTSATPLQYKDANVLWINGLDYMTTLPGDAPTIPTPAASANP